MLGEWNQIKWFDTYCYQGTEHYSSIFESHMKIRTTHIKLHKKHITKTLTAEETPSAQNSKKSSLPKECYPL